MEKQKRELKEKENTKVNKNVKINTKIKNIKLNNKLNFILVLLLILTIIATLPYLITFSRYVEDRIKNYFSQTKEFYFNSDKLKVEDPSYKISNWPGVDPYSIVINVNNMDNNIKATNYPIEYDISYTSSNNVVISSDKTSGIISTETNQDSFVVTVTPNVQLKNGDLVSVNISAMSKTEYEKKLSARFVLEVGQEEILYEIKDSPGKSFILVNITNSLSYYVVRQSIPGYRVGDRISISTYESLSEAYKARCSSAEVRVRFDPNEFTLDTTNTNYIYATNTFLQNIPAGGNLVPGTYLSGIEFKVPASASTNVRLYKSNISADYTYPIVNPSPAVTFEIVRQ